MLKEWRGIFCFLTIIILANFTFACSRTLVDKAFKGKLSLAESNKVITNYCQNCHVHKDKPASNHIRQETDKYKREPFVSASDCRVCHYLKKDFWGRLEQKTHKPDL